MATTTNMQLVLATVEQTLGPEWAELLNAMFERIDIHDHSDGKGVKVTPAGLDINDDLDVAENHLENVNTVGLISNSAAQTSRVRSLQAVGTNLYYINSSGAAVQITAGASVNAPGTGQLSVDAPASYPYSVTTGDSEKVLVIDTTVARTINLPAATNAMFVILKDGEGQANTNNITVSPNGTDTIEGDNSAFTIDTDFGAFGFISDGVSAWHVI